MFSSPSSQDQSQVATIQWNGALVRESPQSGGVAWVRAGKENAVIHTWGSPETVRAFGEWLAGFIVGSLVIDHLLDKPTDGRDFELIYSITDGIAAALGFNFRADRRALAISALSAAVAAPGGHYTDEQRAAAADMCARMTDERNQWLTENPLFAEAQSL